MASSSAQTDKSQRRTMAPFIAGAIVLLAVLGVLLFSWLKPSPYLTVGTLNSPAVAGYSAGGDLYPPNSEFAVEEMSKFGYLSELPVARTSDGVLVAGTDTFASERMGLSQPIAKVTAEEFLGKEITPPGDKGKSSTPLTIENALSKYGKATVFVFTIGSEQDANDIVALVEKYSHAESVIFRSTDADVLRVAQDNNIASLVPNPKAKPAALAKQGVDMVEVSADTDPQPYIDSDLKVWANGVKNPDHLSKLAGKGFFGALSGNPFSIQPSSVKTD